MATETVVVTIKRTDKKTFKSRHAFIEGVAMTFDPQGTAKEVLTVRTAPYRLSWIVTGVPGEYTVVVSQPPSAVDTKANARKRKVDIGGFGGGLRELTISEAQDDEEDI